MPTRRLAIWGLAALIVVSATLHLIRISYPARPAFDEAYFATEAADYLIHQPYLEYHPPLGKMLYAAALAASPHRTLTTSTLFINTFLDADKNITVSTTGEDYGGFPYVDMRLVSAAFGLLLPLVLYAFLRGIGVGPVGSFVGAFMAVFENALLVETRLILLNGMYLAFGLAALAAFFGKRRSRTLAGALFGLAFAVKWVAVVFIVPVAIDWWVRRKAAAEARAEARTASGATAGTTLRWPWGAVRFAAAAIVVYLIILFSNNFFFTPAERYAAWHSLGLFQPETAAASTTAPTFLNDVRASILESVVTLGNYVGGGKGAYDQSSSIGSAWYDWPFMWRPFPYYVELVTGRMVELIGNPMVWYSGTFAMLFCAWFAVRKLIRRIRRERVRSAAGLPPEPWATNLMSPAGSSNRALLLLFGGYWGSMLPFLTVVERTAFLYHYFPALLFSIGLFAWCVDRFLGAHGVPDGSGVPRRYRSAFAAYLLLVAAGFIVIMPFTYGLTLRFF